jgi:cytochrome c peroxidase
MDSTKTTHALKKSKRYIQLFSKAFPHNTKRELISLDQIAAAIAAFEKTLTPMNSPFDQYINGDKAALTAEQISGFNLFMGKAQCGTCHFAPLFNSLLPPYYQLSELEVIGTTQNTNFEIPVADNDSGRFAVFPIPFYKGAFKTPTIRNIAKTAPYMHNGKFKTLEEVIQFYNLGGGKGIGLPLEQQTLSDKPLQLSKEEIKAIVAFLASLTDSLPEYPLSKEFN